MRRRKGRLKPLLLDQSFLAGVGNIYADEALWTARLHPLRSAGSLRPPDERRLYDAIRDDPGRGGRASRQLDRRLHGARWRRLDAGATAGLSAHWRAMSALRAADQADRGRVRGRRTSVPGASGCRQRTARPRRRSCARRPAATAGWPALDRAGGGGEPGPDAARGGAGRDAQPDRTNEAGRRDPSRGRPATAGRRADEHPAADGVTREIGTFVILDAHRRIHRARRPDRPGRAERRRQDDAPADRRRAGRAGHRRGPPQARADRRAARPGGPLRRGVHGRAETSGGGPDRRGAPRPDGRGARRLRA